MILYLALALTLLFVGYVSIVTARHGVLHSISRSFYTLNQYGKGYWFRLLMFTSGLLLIIISAYSVEYINPWALYGSGIGAIGTGAAAMYYDRITGILHYIFSGIMLVFALIFLGLVYSWVPLILIAIGLLIVFGNREKMPNPIFWFEIYAFSGVLTSLLVWSSTL